MLSKDYLIDLPEADFTAGKLSPLLVFAHGAGAGMDSDFINRMTEQLNQRGIAVLRFEFPYMQQRRQTGSRRPPNRQPELVAHWQQVLADVRASELAQLPLYIGGKSMGGRMASLIADQESVAGLVCLGYPFHPQGKPEKLRTEHLYSLQAPTLMLQGTRDALGSRDEVEAYELPASIEFHWLEDGDHDLKPRVKSGFRHQQHLEAAAEAIAVFMQA